MNQHTLKEDSWHMHIANFPGRRIIPQYGTDICEYTRAVASGCISFVGLTALMTAASTWTFLSIDNIIDVIMSKTHLASYAYPFIGMVAGLSVTAVIVVAVNLIHNSFEKKWNAGWRPADEPGFLKLAYRKFKDKTCFKINFVGNEK